MRAEYYPWMDDARLAELVRTAEQKRRWNRFVAAMKRVDWYKLLVWAGCAAYCIGFWWGVARAIDKGF